MKKKVLIFVCVALLVLAFVPIFNLMLGNLPNKSVKTWTRSVLYNLDFALPYQSRLLYSLGISTNPNHVIIGKDHWLYLGDQYEKTITIGRRGTTDTDADVARNIGCSMKLWNQWLMNHGVHLYKVMLAPNKSTIYPEFLPDWAKPAADSATSKLLSNVGQDIYVDTRSAMIAKKSAFGSPLYHNTDSHWNSLGAWVAFHAFTIDILRSEPGLRILSEKQVRISKVNERHGGDLANFLRMTDFLQDTDVVIIIDTEHPIETEQYDFETDHLTASGGNAAFGVPQHPLIVKSKYALNHKKVIWLRDSFGSDITPYMAATFTETLQLDYRLTDPKLFVQLVNKYKPEYVFISVAERDAYSSWFEHTPPVTMTPAPVFGNLIRPDIPLGGDCHIDSINDEPGEGTPSHTIKGSSRILYVAGWAAISVKNGVAASDMAIALKGKSGQGTRLFATVIRSKRQDVADYFKNPTFLDTGFYAAIDLSDQSPGEYVLEVIQHKDGENFKCPVTSKIFVEK